MSWQEAREAGAALVATLKAERIEQGIIQARLADKAGIVRSQLNFWERGTTQPGIGYLVLWARALGFRVLLVPIAEEEADE